MITNRSIDIENCESRIANIESKIQAAEVAVETAKSNLDAAVNEKAAAEAALAEQEKLEDYVLYMIGNVKASATLRGARTHNDKSMAWWYFNSKEDFAQEVAANLKATSTENTGRWVGSHKGCRVLVWFENGETLVTIRDAQQLLSTTLTNESTTRREDITESISERQITSVLADARDQAEEFGTTSEFTFEYYIGSSVSAAGYSKDKLFMFLPDHVTENDREYLDAVRGWKENEGIDSSEDDNFIADDDM